MPATYTSNDGEVRRAGIMSTDKYPLANATGIKLPRIGNTGRVKVNKWECILDKG